MRDFSYFRTILKYQILCCILHRYATRKHEDDTIFHPGTDAPGCCYALLDPDLELIDRSSLHAHKTQCIPALFYMFYIGYDDGQYKYSVISNRHQPLIDSCHPDGWQSNTYCKIFSVFPYPLILQKKYFFRISLHFVSYRTAVYSIIIIEFKLEIGKRSTRSLTGISAVDDILRIEKETLKCLLNFVP